MFPWICYVKRTLLRTRAPMNHEHEIPSPTPLDGGRRHSAPAQCIHSARRSVAFFPAARAKTSLAFSAKSGRKLPHISLCSSPSKISRTAKPQSQRPRTKDDLRRDKFFCSSSAIRRVVTYYYLKKDDRLAPRLFETTNIFAQPTEGENLPRSSKQPTHLTRQSNRIQTKTTTHIPKELKTPPAQNGLSTHNPPLPRRTSLPPRLPLPHTAHPPRRPHTHPVPPPRGRDGNPTRDERLSTDMFRRWNGGDCGSQG